MGRLENNEFEEEEFTLKFAIMARKIDWDKVKRERIVRQVGGTPAYIPGWHRRPSRSAASRQKLPRTTARPYRYRFRKIKVVRKPKERLQYWKPRKETPVPNQLTLF